MTQSDGQKSFQERLARLEQSQSARGGAEVPPPPGSEPDFNGPRRAPGGGGSNWGPVFFLLKGMAVFLVLVVLAAGAFVAFGDRLGPAFALLQATGQVDPDEIEKTDPAQAAKVRNFIENNKTKTFTDLGRDGMKLSVVSKARAAGHPDLAAEAARRIDACTSTTCLARVEVETLLEIEKRSP